jgi:cytidine deaminase
MDRDVKETLIALAVIAQGNSYSPYSNYPVGAAVVAANPTGGLQFFTGTNIENASYGLTICAERVAIFTAIASGYTDLIAMACVTQDGEGTSCGSCRQVEYEFAPDMKMYFCNDLGEIISEHTPEKLLPEAFNKERLDV